MTKALLALAVVAATTFILFLVAPILGALTGLIVGWVFGDTVLYVLGQVGLHGVAMWQLGLTLGFVGGFIRSIQTNTNA